MIDRHYASYVSARRLPELRDQASLRELSLEAYEAIVARHLSSVFERAVVAMRVEPSAFRSILRDGYFKTAREFLGPDVPLLKTELGFEWSLIHARLGVEQEVFPDGVRFGYLCRDERLDRWSSVDPYGSIKITFHDEIKPRVTVTIGSSFNGLYAGSLLPAPVTAPHCLCAPEWMDPLAWLTVDPLPAQGGYEMFVEAQLHGRLTLDDIVSVESAGPLPDVAGQLRARGVKVHAGGRLPLGGDEGVREAVFRCAINFNSEIHGPEHWDRVMRTGLALAARTDGANENIVAAFALFHDAFREDDGEDPDHGRRAAAAAEAILIDSDGFTREDVVTLSHACALHADGLISDDPTVGVCWDADRLDLPRVGITPSPGLLSTTAARACVNAEAQ